MRPPAHSGAHVSLLGLEVNSLVCFQLAVNIVCCAFLIAVLVKCIMLNSNIRSSMLKIEKCTICISFEIGSFLIFKKKCRF